MAAATKELTVDLPVVLATNSEPLKCPKCPNTKEWNYNITYTTRMDISTGKALPRLQTKEEVRCAMCGTKATIDITEGVRGTDVWKGVRKLEDDLCKK